MLTKPDPDGEAVSEVVQLQPEEEETTSDRVGRAMRLMQIGDTERARNELETVISTAPNHRVARHLLRQLDADPEAYLGTTHFLYEIQPGDSLWLIAERFLGDSLKFYILARYNGIKNPSTIPAGRMLKIPGEELSPPHLEVESLYEQALVQIANGELEQAYEKLGEALVVQPDHGPAQEQLASIQKTLADIYHEQAIMLYEQQELEAAVERWDKVLELQPQHASARRYRTRAAIELCVANRECI